MNFARFLTVTFLAFFSSLVVASNPGERLIIAQSLQEFELPGVEICDRLAGMDEYFPMGFVDLGEIRNCRKSLASLMLDENFKPIKPRDSEHAKKLANLWIWDGLLTYWITQLDHPASASMIWLASGSLLTAANLLKEGQAGLSELFRATIIGLSFRAQSTLGTKDFPQAYRNLTDLHEMLEFDRENIAGKERKALRAYSSYWLSRLSMQSLFFSESGESDSSFFYRMMLESSRESPDPNASLAYLLSLSHYPVFISVNVSPPKRLPAIEYTQELELAATRSGNVQVLLWNMVDQAKLEYFSVHSVDDASYSRIEQLLGRISELNGGNQFPQFYLDSELIRIRLALKFHDHVQAQRILEELSPQISELNELAARESPEMRLWAGRYFQLIDYMGQILVQAGDMTGAQEFFSQLPTESFPSAALNLSAIYMLDGQHEAALDVLSRVDEAGQSQDPAIYRHNLVLARHLAGDIKGAIEILDNDELSGSGDVEIGYKAALLALNEQFSEATALIQAHAGAGYGQLGQSLLKTMLAIHRLEMNRAELGEVINTPSPQFSFLNDPKWLSSDFEKNGIPYFQTVDSEPGENQAVLVTGFGPRGISKNASLSENGKFTALASNNMITIWDNSNGLPFRRLTEADSIGEMLFLDGDSHLLVASKSALNMWDLARGEIVFSLPTVTCYTCAIKFSSGNQSIYFQNPYGRLVKAPLSDLSESSELLATEDAGWTTPNDLGTRLFFIRTNYDEQGNSTSRLVSYDLLNNEELHQSGDLIGDVRGLWFARASQKLLLLRDMRNSDEFSAPVKMQLTILDTNDEFNEELHFDFDSRVSFLGELDGGNKLLFSTFDKDVILDLESAAVEPAPFGSRSRVLGLSPSGDSALVNNEETGELSLIGFPSLETISKFNQTTSGAGRAYYDEDTQRLMVASGHDQLNLWDMKSGLEIQRRALDTDLKPIYIRQQLGAIVDTVQKSYPENNQWFKLENDQLIEKSIPVPDEILQSDSIDYLQVIETSSFLYFAAREINGEQDIRIWRSDHEFQNTELLEWTLDSENLVAILEEPQLVIHSSENKVLISSLQDGTLIHEIAAEDEFGNPYTLTPGWIDEQYETIWLEYENQLRGYDFSGSLKHSFTDEIGFLGHVSGIHSNTQFVATYSIADSTLVRKIDRQTGQVLRNDVLFNQSAGEINHSSRGKYLLITTREGSIVVWSLQENTPLFSMFLLPGDNWAVIDPAGRFDTNDPGELDSMAWRLPEDPLKAYPVEIFLRNYYEPRLIPRLMNKAPFAEVPNLNTINRWQPSVEIESLSPTKSGTVDIVVRLTQGEWPDQQQTRAYDLRLFRDGQQVAVFPQDHGQVVFEKGQKTVLFQGIGLPNTGQGETLEFTAFAFNSDGVKSRTARHEYTHSTTALTAVANAYVLNIGINNYTDESWNLAFAGNDAELLSETLVASVRTSGEFDSVRQMLLIATENDLIDRDRIQKALVSLKEGDGDIPRATPNDTIVMSWAGHGFVDEHGEFYLLTSEVGQNSNDMNSVLKGAISATQFSRWIEAIDVGRFVLIIDACYSAAAVDAGEFKPGPMGNKGFGQLAWYKGMQVLTASQANDVALESDLLEHGLLTYALVEDGLKAERADHLPQDGAITAKEWLKYAQRRVPEIFQALIEDDGGEFSGRGGFASEEAPPIREIQQPALFDFYRGSNVLEIFLDSGNQAEY